MKRNSLHSLLCITVIILVLCFVMPVSGALAADVFPGGWRNPLGPEGGDLNIISTGTFNLDSYFTKYQQAHGGVDMYYYEDSRRKKEPVYAIGDGVVQMISEKLDDSGRDISVIHVNHEAADGTVFKATYGHTRPVNGLKEGDSVIRGQQIGHTTLFNSYHLHFAIVWNRQKTPSSWGGLKSDLLGSATSTQARLEALHTYGWWEPFEFLAAHPSEEHYVVDEFYGVVELMDQTEFFSKPDNESGTGDYAQRSDVLPVYGIVTDKSGDDWYALSRSSEYFIPAGSADLKAEFAGEPVRLSPVNATQPSDALAGKVGQVLDVSADVDTRYTAGKYTISNVSVTCLNENIAQVQGGRMTILGTGETMVRISCKLTGSTGTGVQWVYDVPLTVKGTVDEVNAQAYEVVYSSGLRIRETPTTSGASVVVMPCGTIFTADMSQTVEADGYTWAYVTAETGETGWTAISNSEYCKPLSGYTLSQAGTYDGRRYLVYEGDGTWEEAKTFVASLGDGWHLATITSAEEQAAVSRLVSAYGGICWLGGKYSGGWTWVTGEDFNVYTNWDDNEPSGNSSEPYLGIYGNSTQTSYATDGKWNDFKASTTSVNGFVAEKDVSKQIIFAEDAMQMNIGETTSIDLTVEPPLAGGETLTYTAGNGSVISVDANGMVTGLKEGASYVTATAPGGGSNTISVYVFNQDPVKVDSADLKAFSGQTHRLEVTWNEESPMRSYLESFEVLDAFSDSELLSHEGGDSFYAQGNGVALVWIDLEYTTTAGEKLRGDTLLVPVVVGDIFEPEREHYECAAGDDIRILHVFDPGEDPNTLLTWESTDENYVTVDQQGRFTGVKPGHAGVEVYATWAKIPVGYIDISVMEYDTLTLPDKITALGTDALRGIAAERVDARGTALSRIESGAMKDMPNLRSVCLDNAVTYIAPDAFEGSNLIWIHCPDGSYAHQWALENSFYPNVW